MSKKELKSAELFWQNDIVSTFMVCCINDNSKCETKCAQQIKEALMVRDFYELDKNDVRNEVIEKLHLSDDLDFIIFIFIIANQIKDQELLDLIENKDEIKSFAFDYSDKIRVLIDNLKDSKMQEILQSIEDYFIYNTDTNADKLIAILKETHNELEISYNENLTSAIHNMIDSNAKYKDIYNEVKSKISLKVISEKEKRKIYDLISTRRICFKYRYRKLFAIC